MKKYDFIIIGGGAAGFAAAIRANELKAKTALVNTGLPLGGTCVNVGCVPSKALLYAAEVLQIAKHHGIPGINLEVKSFDFQKVIQDELALVDNLQKEKYESVLKDLEHIEHIEGRAKFISKNEIEVNGETLQAEKFIIVTGSTATIPPIKGIQETGYVTHIEALKLKEQPKELVVVGGGPLGLEFAQMYARFGTTVTILERGDIIPHTEKEISLRLKQILEKEGIAIKTKVEIQFAQIQNGKKSLTYTMGGKEETISADEILLAIGKTPNTQELDLLKAGVEVNEHKAIIVNEKMQTSAQHIYAAGDVTDAPLRLETTAGREGTISAENALNNTGESMDYNTIPYAIFTDPQVAGVGFTEEQQIEKTGVCACRTVSFEHLPKALIIHRTEGLIKMAIDPKTQQILGVHIVGPQAAELIAGAMMLVKNKNTIDDVVKSVPMFPTLSEAIKLVALSFTKNISKISCCV